MLKKPILAVIAIAAACVSAPAVSQSNFYAVFNLGRTSLDADPAAINAFALRNGLTTSSTVTSNDDRGYKAQLGYRFTPIWSLEGGYTSLGKATYTNVNDVAVVNGKKEADLWNIDLVGTLPLNPSWALLGRVGAYRWDTKSDVPTLAGPAGVIKDKGTDFKVGAGVQYSLTANFDIRAEYEHFRGIGDQTTTGEANVNMYSIGVVLKF